MISRKYLRPGNRGQALQDVLSEVFGREVAVLEQSASLHLDVTDRSELFDESTERMKGADGLQGHEFFYSRIDRASRLT